MSTVPEPPDDRGEATPLSMRPDELRTFRLGRLLLLLEVAGELRLHRALDIERLGYYDFFADNPFLVVADPRSRNRLALAGFAPSDLSYQSSAHRFETRRSELKQDLSMLLAYGVAEATIGGRRIVYGLSPRGLGLVARLTSLYAKAFRTSARIVVKELDKVADRPLSQQAHRWLASPDLIDLFERDEATV